jgi:uncharacterized Fe-S center protein
MDADIFISLSHFKGHEATGFGGALKNIGMGCGSRAGKMEMHNAGKPFVNEDCIACGMCLKACAHSAITIDNGSAYIDHNKCVGCGRCIGVCPKDAVDLEWDEANTVLNKKIAEYAYAVLKDKPHFHICLAMDITPYCDCHSENDVSIIPDVGMFASFDPVALDVCCADMCNKMPMMPNSFLSDHDHGKADHFHNMHPETEWEACTERAEQLGIGTRDYEMIKIG